VTALPGAAGRITDAVDNAPEVTRLRTEKSSLEAITKPKSGKSFGEVGGAFSQLKDVSHRLSVLETGTGIYEGSECETKTAGAKSSNCTLIVLEVLENTFVQQGREADWKKVKKKYQAITKARKGTLSGLDIQTALQVELGWKGIFWAPDPKYSIPKEELSGARSDEAEYVAGIAKKKGTYYKKSAEGDPGLSIDQVVINYAPEAPTAGHGTASTTKKDTSALDKLKKLPFGVLTTHGAFHMALFTYGKVIEVHWDEEATSADVTQQTDLENWAVGPESGYHYFASGAIVAPASDVDKAFK